MRVEIRSCLLQQLRAGRSCDENGDVLIELGLVHPGCVQGLLNGAFAGRALRFEPLLIGAAELAERRHGEGLRNRGNYPDLNGRRTREPCGKLDGLGARGARAPRDEYAKRQDTVLRRGLSFLGM